MFFRDRTVALVGAIGHAAVGRHRLGPPWLIGPTSSSSAPASAAWPRPFALAASGRRVVVCERRDVTGGKLACLQRDGFSIDIGPSLLTLPNVFDELFRAAGTTLSEHVELVRLDPQFHYRWSDGSSLVVPDGPDATAAAFERFAPGAGEQWRRFDERAGRIWEVAARTFLAGPMGGPWELARRLRSPADLVAIQPHRTLHDLAAAHFTDPRLVQWAGRYATYSGSSPYRAPATLACIAHVEARHGCWYVRGGLEVLRSALESRGREQPAPRCGSGAEVVRIAAPAGRVTGVELADGTSDRRPGRRRQRGRRASPHHVAAGSAGAACRPPCRSLDERPGDRCRRARPDRGDRAPQRVVLARRSRRVRRPRGGSHGRCADDLRMRLGA